MSEDHPGEAADLATGPLAPAALPDAAPLLNAMGIQLIEDPNRPPGSPLLIAAGNARESYTITLPGHPSIKLSDVDELHDLRATVQAIRGLLALELAKRQPDAVLAAIRAVLP